MNNVIGVTRQNVIVEKMVCPKILSVKVVGNFRKIRKLLGTLSEVGKKDQP